MATPCTIERAAVIMGGVDAAGEPAPLGMELMRRYRRSGRLPGHGRGKNWRTTEEAAAALRDALAKEAEEAARQGGGTWAKAAPSGGSPRDRGASNTTLTASPGEKLILRNKPPMRVLRKSHS